jgi:hypothetical protein
VSFVQILHNIFFSEMIFGKKKEKKKQMRLIHLTPCYPACMGNGVYRLHEAANFMEKLLHKSKQMPKQCVFTLVLVLESF